MGETFSKKKIHVRDIDEIEDLESGNNSLYVKFKAMIGYGTTDRELGEMLLHLHEVEDAQLVMDHANGLKSQLQKVKARVGSTALTHSEEAKLRQQIAEL